jgi:CheY-like chemotaxis protein
MAHKLLLADDSVTIQRVIELTFADEDVEVMTVGDGQLAIERLDNDPPDIVLADVDMPKRDGYEIAAYVKSRPKLAHIPVVLLTGAFEPIDAARAAAAGSNDVLAKPFEPQMVINRVKELLTRKSQTAPPIDAAWPRPADVSTHQPPLSEPSALFASPEPADAAEIVSLDDYFDQLDAAFSNLQAEPASARKQADQLEWAAVAIEAPAPAVEVKSEPAAALASVAGGETAALHLDSDEPSDFPAEASAFAPQPASGPVSVAAPNHDVAPLVDPPAATPLFEPAIAPFPMPTAVPALVATPEPLPAAPVEVVEPAPQAVAQADAPIVPFMAMHAEPPPAPKPIAPAAPRAVANPFATLSAAKAEAAARPAAPVITDEVIEEVVSRVLQRLSDKVVRETVTEIVSQTAERLVQEEIERIKQAQ